MKKVFVEVIVKHSKEGQKIPMSVTWEDRRSYEVDKVIDIRKAASMKVGGCGIRYTCRIMGQETYLFFEDEKWFVEARKEV